MKKVMFVLMVIGLLSIEAQAIYVDAEGGAGGNTVNAVTSSATDWWIQDTQASDDKWDRRAFGYDQNGVLNGATKDIFQSTGGGYFDDSPMLITTVSGLTPGQFYEVKVLYWLGTTNTMGQPNWNIRAGFAADSLQLFDMLGTLPGAIAGVRGEQDGTSDRYACRGTAGTTAADINGQIKVYIDDLPATANNLERTWYDGLEVNRVTSVCVAPANGATNVAINQDLSWAILDSNVTSFDLYFGTQNDPNLSTNPTNKKLSKAPTTTTAWDTGAMAYDTIYFWKIDTYEPNTLGGADIKTEGKVWSFSTLPSSPIVPADQPASVRVFPGGPAVFTVLFTSASAATVKWYKNDNTTVTEVIAGITTTDNGGGSWTTTLDFGVSVSASDEGQYYCSVTNDGGAHYYDSGAANLVIHRQLAKYNFDGDLADNSTNGAPTGTAMDSLGDPNTLLPHVPAAIHYVTGADGTAGSAVVLDPNEYIDFSVNGYPKASPVTSNGYGGGLDSGTIIYWVKPNTAAYQIILGNFNDTTNGVGFLSALQADEDQDLLIRDAGIYLANHVAARPNRPEYNLTDGNWHMMAACWSGNTSTLYVDGQWVGSFTGAAPTSYSAWQYGVLLGASRQAARYLLSDMFRGGAIDNLRIYNYRLDADSTDVFAQEYLNNTSIHPCTNMSFVGNAFNHDNTGSSYCKVDMADFAMFAGAWLADGLY
jgi:hypothetical protein